MKIVFAGDSNTAAQYVTEAQTFAKLVADSMGAAYVNSGVSGSKASGLLANLQSRVFAHAPSSCVVMIGTNDLAWAFENDKTIEELLAVYLPDMADIIDAVKAADIHLIVLSPPMTRITKITAMQTEFTAALKKLCARKDVLCLDVYDWMEINGQTMSEADFNAWWLAVGEGFDNYHLSAVGHRRIADLVLTMRFPETAVGILLEQTLTSSFGNMASSTAKVRIKLAALTVPSGAVTKMRFTFQGHTDEPLQLGAIYVGQKASSGDSWDAASLVPITYSGVNAFTVPQAGTLVSDWITFDWNRTSDLIVSFYANGGTTNDKLASKDYGSDDTKALTHHKSGNEAATANASDYSTYNHLSLVSKIETDGF